MFSLNRSKHLFHGKHFAAAKLLLLTLQPAVLIAAFLAAHQSRLIAQFQAISPLPAKCSSFLQLTTANQLQHFSNTTELKSLYSLSMNQASLLMENAFSVPILRQASSKP